MDGSMDSIGSCSLDVDANSSDVSESSASLNYSNTTLAKEVNQELPSNHPGLCHLNAVQKNSAFMSTESQQTTIIDKKPSYLNLACCVSGYSNLNTYDSKARQDINKSREVSPIRPSSTNLQYCMKNNSLAPPLLSTMPNIILDKPCTKQPPGSSALPSFESCNNNNNLRSKTNTFFVNNGIVIEESPSRSFIEQRIERLYGPGALAHGFYSPRKIRVDNASNLIAREPLGYNKEESELVQKFKKLSPIRASGDLKTEQIKYNVTSEKVESKDEYAVLGNDCVDLPVLRHLSQEFRAQLPTISPKKVSRLSTVKNLNSDKLKYSDQHANVEDVPEIKETKPNDASDLMKTNGLNQVEKTEFKVINNMPLLKKDGNFFLKLLKEEQSRLLALADDAEKVIGSLSKNAGISEDTLGLLRSASGKARLLVSQKMKQFEGLCQNNLNSKPSDKFPTTIDDLQGFWDMVNLQIVHVDTIFAEIENLKANGWKSTGDDIENNIPTKPPKSNKGISKSKGPNTNNTKTLTAMSAAALKRESQRKQLLEMKRKRRMEMASNLGCNDDDEVNNVSSSAIQIFVNKNIS